MTLQSHSQEELGGGEIWTNTLMHAVTKKKNLLKMELDCVWRWREDENVISQHPRDFSEDVKDKRQE